MAIIEIAISCDGFPLYKRIFVDIKAIDDDDAIASALYALFYRIEKSIIPDVKSNTVLKLDMDRYYMHALKTVLDPATDGAAHEVYIYIIEDGNLDKKTTSMFMKKMLSAFVKSYNDKIVSMLKESIDLHEFDPVIDKILGGMLKKQKKSAPAI
ncbi:MAG TPA: hypothetical protein VKM55_08260 [Candidatus Lokiarchaeia archaeon]|nr:hypothetical protein [Candidatus Lokiarchaeia archaeon]